MLKSPFWTKSQARLQFVRHTEGRQVNWLFLPGGPGLGSESLIPLLNVLKLPGNLWRLDLPGDGSNTTSDCAEAFSHWPLALVEAIREFNDVILVAHSTAGMYALSLPELENLLDGLVLLDSAPDATWQASFANIVHHFPVPGLEALQEKYQKDPNNETLKALTIASAPYLFTQQGQALGIQLLQSLPYSYQTCQWSEKHFDQLYRAKWVPQTIPTLILSGEEDLLTPLKLFEDQKRFCRDNITLKSIRKAGHFPWIENPTEVVKAFSEYVDRLFRWQG